MSDEENKTRATTGVKFSAFQQVGPQDGNPMEVVGLRDGENVRAVLTTDMVETNPELIFRNAKGQFTSVGPGITELTNQLKVNRYLYDRMVERGVTIDVVPPDIYAEGTFWFCNSESSMQLFVYHDESDAWIPVAPPATIADRVAKGEETQSGLVEAVGELETKVTALEGAVGEHSLIFNPDRTTPRAGEFVTKDGANQVVNTLSAAAIIHIAPEDRNGGAIAIDRITEGDVMRLSDISGVTAEVRIKDNLGGGAYAMEKLFGDLDRLSEYPYDFNLFSSFDPQGLATIDYVDEQDDKKLDKSGGIIDGALHFQRGSKDFPQLRITPNDGTNYGTSIYAMHDAELRLRSSHTDNEVDHVGSHIIISANEGAPSTKIYHVPEPTQSHMAASKGYVDQQISSGIFTQLWKYCEGKDRSELKAREFTVNFVDGDKDKIEIYIYPYLNGRWWAPAINTNYTHQIGEAYCTISDWQGACAVGFKALKWWFIQQGYDSGGTKRWHNALQGNYYKLAYPDKYRLKDQHWYNLNLPSPFPLVNFPEELHTGEVGAFGIEPEEAPVPPDAIDMGEVLP